MSEVMAIEASSMTKYFGEFLAGSPISFEVDQEGVVSFLGPNSARTSTIIRTLTEISISTDCAQGEWYLKL